MSTLNFISKPSHSIHGDVFVPGDKSISHRAIIFGAIAKGVTVIEGFLDGDDCLATLKAFQAMGVVIERPEPHQVIVHGVGQFGLKKPAQAIDCGNSGTSMRLLAGLLAAQSFDSQLTGDDSLLKRPMLRIAKPLTQMGADIVTQDGKPPIYIRGGKKLTAIDYTMPEASAQVKSCILLAGLYAEGQTRIKEQGSSRDHTERMLKAFSYPVEYSDQSIIIHGNSEGIGTIIKVPGDISSAAFFVVAASIIPDSNVIIRHVGMNPTRTGVIDILLKMGADIQILNQHQEGEEWVADMQVKSAALKGITIPSTLVPSAIDEFPIIFIAAACAKGQTTLRDARELRVKESDRIGAMIEGLTRLGVDAQALDDGAIIQGGAMHGGVVDSRGDHRIAMSFAIAGAAASQSVTIQNCANIATSFPDFISTAKALHLQIEVKNNE